MPIKCLITKSQLDAHDKGARFVANALKQAGMEVIYTRFAMAEEIVEVALQEDVDIIGISLLCGGYTYTVSKVIQLLNENNMNIPVMIGGQVPDDARKEILEMGVDRVFPQGISSEEVIRYINSRISRESNNLLC